MEFFCKILLPKNYRTDHLFAHHKRDPHSLATRIDENCIEKGFVLHGKPCCLLLNFLDSSVEVALLADGELENFTEDDLEALAFRFLGLDQRIEVFEKKFSTHPQLSKFLSHTRGLRITTTLTCYEALTRSIFGQQLSIHAAFSIARKFVREFGPEHSSGLRCYPSPQEVRHCDVAAFRQLGCSVSKAQTIVSCTQAFVDGELDANLSSSRDLLALRENLLLVKGIGAWTADNTLMRSYGWPDASMHKDLGVRKKLQMLLSSADLPTERCAEIWLSQFAPWRGLVAMHLWCYDL